MDLPLPSLLLEQLPQQVEVRDLQDDWTGLTDPVGRRRLQNRLNQRAWRRRKANQRRKLGLATGWMNCNAEEHITSAEEYFGTITEIGSLGAGAKAPDQSFFDATGLIHASGPVTRRSDTSCKLNAAEIQKMMLRFEKSAYREYALGSPRVDHLLSLIQFNVFQALFSNTNALGFTLEWLNEDSLSPFTMASPENLNASCPPGLRPTKLQCTIPHHPWFDLFPIPTMRDNILRAGDSLDETELCMDLVEFWSSPSERSGLVVWGDPWDPRSWEVSEEFLKKWSWVIRGCHELFKSTNYWRMKRGEKSLFSNTTLVELALL